MFIPALKRQSVSKMTRHRDQHSEKSHKSRAKLQRREPEQKLFPNDATGAQGHKTCNGLLCNESWRWLCVSEAGFGRDFCSYATNKHPQEKSTSSGLQHRRTHEALHEIGSNTSTSGARDVFLIKRHSTHTACVSGKHATQPRHILTTEEKLKS